jgi:hypothetical protein
MDHHRHVGSETPTNRPYGGSGEVCNVLCTVDEIVFHFGSDKVSSF